MSLDFNSLLQSSDKKSVPHKKVLGTISLIKV